MEGEVASPWARGRDRSLDLRTCFVHRIPDKSTWRLKSPPVSLLRLL